MAAAHVPAPAPAAGAASVQHAIVRMLNRDRARRGLPALRASRGLTFVAGLHSLDLASHDLLSHDSSDGTPFERRVRSVTRARAIGETIAEVRGPVRARAVLASWLRSPAHRRELLDPAFRRVGVALARSGATSVVTADFASGR